MPITLDYIKKHGFHKNYDKDFNDRAHDAQQRLIAVIREFDEKRMAIMADQSLSTVGKQQVQAKLSEELLKRVDEVDRQHVSHERHALKEFEARMFTTKPGDAVRAIQEMEIRNHLKSLDKFARMEAFYKSIESGDEVVYSAIINSPATLPLVPPSVIAEGRIGWVRRNVEDGELRVKQYLNGIEIVEQLTSNVEDVRELLGPETTLADRLHAS